MLTGTIQTSVIVITETRDPGPDRNEGSDSESTGSVARTRTPQITSFSGTTVDHSRDNKLD